MIPIKLTMMDDGSPVYVYRHQVVLVRNARGGGGGTLIVLAADSVTVREALLSVIAALNKLGA